MSKSLKIFQDLPSLDDIQVASPCPAEWGDMVGSDTVRFCASCQKNVYNLSGMKRDEALELLRASEGRMCVRFFRRADGTILTEDCPVGVALVLRRAKRMTLAAAAVSLGAVAALLALLGGNFTKKTCERIDSVKTHIESVMPVIPETPMQETAGEPMPVQPMEAMQGGAAVRPEPPVQELKGKVALPDPVIEVKGDVKRPEKHPTMGTMAHRPVQHTVTK